jgi:hypothetical protein
MVPPRLSKACSPLDLSDMKDLNRAFDSLASPYLSGAATRWRIEGFSVCCMPSDRTTLTQERLKELLHYDPETGHFTWRTHRGGKATPGSIAGNRTPRGYRDIIVDGNRYMAHRLAFLYMTGSFPDAEADHVDRDASNNRWRNLRPATRSENGSNRALQVNNSSGARNVHWLKTRRKWQARGNLHGKQKHLGLFDDIEEAAAVAEAWRKEHHGEFYSCPQPQDPLPPKP